MAKNSKGNTGSGNTGRTRSQIGRLSRTKGHTFERWVANQLKPIYADAHRQPQSQIKLLKQINDTLPVGIGKRALTDVVAGPWAIECKHRKVLPKIEDTLKQAEEDAAGSNLTPLAVHKPSPGTVDDIVVGWRHPDGSVVVVKWVDFYTHLKQ